MATSHTDTHQEVALLLACMGSGTSSSRLSSPTELLMQKKLDRLDRMLDAATPLPLSKKHHTWRSRVLAKTRTQVKKRTFVKALKTPFMCISYRMLTLGDSRSRSATMRHTDHRSTAVALGMMECVYNAHENAAHVSRTPSASSSNSFASTVAL